MKIAFITGATSGIGREFCVQVDKNGYDEIWGVGLGKEGFESLKNTLKTKVRDFELDLTKKQSFDIIQNELEKQKPQIEFLVNASGFGKFARYDEYDIETKENMIELNCIALVKLTEMLLPYIVEGGRIVEVASVAAFQPTPYVSVYAATKAFVLSYSRAMNVELKHRKISVTALCPFWTKTAFFDTAKKINSKTGKQVITKYTAMYDTSFVVKKALKAAQKRKDVCIPGFIAKNQTHLVKLLPHKLILKIWCSQQKFEKTYSDK